MWKSDCPTARPASASTPWRLTGGVEVQCHSFLTSALEGSQRSTSRPGCFTPVEIALGKPRIEAGLAAEPVWTFWREKISVTAGNWILNPLVLNLDSWLAMPSRFPGRLCWISNWEDNGRERSLPSLGFYTEISRRDWEKPRNFQWRGQVWGPRFEHSFFRIWNSTANC
jgi:hypothetical protein